MFSVLNRRERTKKYVSITDILQDNSRQVCTETMEKMDIIFDGFSSLDYFLVTGGTGAAWIDQIKERYKNIEGMVVISGRSDQFPNIFNNVRGYFLFLCKSLM